MIKPNPFTPKSGVEPRVFTNREEEIKFFLKRVKEASKGNINHYIINGEWGSGKTSLLRYFKLLAQEQKYAVCYFPAREFPEESADIEISTHIIQSMIRSLPYKLSKKDSKFYAMVKGIGIQVLGSGFNISFEIDENKHLDPQIFCMDSLLNLWKDVKKQTELLIVLIDDVQNYSKVQRLFTALKNVLSDEAVIKQTKILFILSSTIEGWKPFMQMNHPVGRFFIPRIELGNFSYENTMLLIDSALKGTGVSFSDSIKEKIYKYTNGHLFQIHSISGALYDNQKSGKIADEEWEKGFYEGLLYLGNVVYEGLAQSLSHNEIEIVKHLDMFENLYTSNLKNIKIKSVNEYLKRLTTKGVLKNVRRGEYQVRDILLCEYIRQFC